MGIDSLQRQKKQELKILGAFIKVSGLPIPRQTVRPMNPPHPDIVCDIDGEGTTAFELVEIIDTSFANNLAKQIKTKQTLNCYFHNLKSAQKLKLQELYSDAVIFVQFKQNLSFRKRENMFVEIFQFLSSIASGFQGDAINGNPHFRGRLDRIFITRIKGLLGPLFDFISGGSIGDPSISCLKDKYAAVYQSGYPIHLLAYIDINPMFPDEIWLTNLKQFVETTFDKSQFKKLWVFDYNNDILKYQYPPNQSIQRMADSHR